MDPQKRQSMVNSYKAIASDWRGGNGFRGSLFSSAMRVLWHFIVFNEWQIEWMASKKQFKWLLLDLGSSTSDVSVRSKANSNDMFSYLKFFRTSTTKSVWSSRKYEVEGLPKLIIYFISKQLKKSQISITGVIILLTKSAAWLVAPCLETLPFGLGFWLQPRVRLSSQFARRTFGKFQTFLWSLELWPLEAPTYKARLLLMFLKFD